MTARRLFFALWPDDRTRQALYHWQTHNLPANVRWQHRADLHMTLHFLGGVAASAVDELLRLGDETRAEGCSLVLDEIGYWHKPQVLWAGPTSLPGELSSLQQRLGEGLAHLGYQPEQRIWQPHVTLARRVREAPLCQPLLPLTWTVGEFDLVESRAGTEPMYHPLRCWKW